MQKKYYLGLDIGTSSVGFAVTDENYNVLKAKGKKLWGVRLFDEASTAEERRMKRGNRRRLDRRKLKLAWLQEIFADEINKIDDKFLYRIKYSSLYLEDKLILKSGLSKDSLFNDKIDGKVYTDREFHKEYPTIYHLRKKLLYEPAKDVRFLYLAMHNLLKRRGNFLYDGDLDAKGSLKECYNEFLNTVESLKSDDVFYSEFSLQSINEEIENEIVQFLKDKHGIRDTKLKMYDLLTAKSKLDKKFVDIIVDGKINISDIFNIELEEKIKLSFQDENVDDVLSSLENILTEEQNFLINKLKELYSQVQLKKILTNNNYISEAMVDVYETHKKELSFFKKFIKKYHASKYYDIFRNPNSKVTNYPLYANIDSFNGSKHNFSDSVDRSKESFYKYVKDIVSSNPEIQNYDEESFNNDKSLILSWIENDNFLLKQRTKNNSIFPNALIINEARKILQTNKNSFPFLTKTDESGLSNIDKIISILKFRVPYFLGPLGNNKDAENNFTWSEKENTLPLKPWTLNKIYNFDKSEDKFIQRMTNKCSYLHDKDVLPKHSLVYSEFRVLNELNNLKINGEEISVELKQNIFNNLFKNNKKVTKIKLKEFLISENYYTKDEIKNLVFSGIDKEFANQLSSYTDLLNKGFSKDFIEKNEEVFENIIKYHTIISDKNRLIKRVKREYGNLFSEEELKGIKALNYTKWGNLSYEFLCGLKFANKATGEITNILDELYNTNQNLQQIIFNSNYTLGDELLKHNNNTLKEITYQDVQDLYCSPSVKRAVWQTISIVNEIKELLGSLPELVFVEVTRDDETKGDKGRKFSRKDSLLKLYSSKEFLNSVNASANDIEKLQEELNKIDNLNLRSDKLYLYFLQLGKCAYSGKPIDINELSKEHIYDIDHIIPQAMIKDDSINNKVLVLGTYNKAKGDDYPVYSTHKEWVEKMRPFWELLEKQNLMSKTKLDRLVRKTQLSREELAGFIERQLVETNQSAKAVIDLLKRLIDNPNKIVYSKAKFVSDFRQKYNIYKSREVNDLHHAKDSYLNIVVGNVIYSRFTLNPRNFYKSDNANNKLTLNTKKLFDNVVKTYKGDRIVWNGEKDIIKIKDVCGKNDCLISRMSYSHSNGAFYDETIYKSQNNSPKTKAKISLKGSSLNPLGDVKKYGGFGKLNYAYFMLVESEDKKGNRIKTIEAVPILIVRQFKNAADIVQRIFDYVAKENNLKNAKLLIPKINFQSILKIGSGEYLLGGKTGSEYILHNFNEWYVDSNTTKYIKIITKYMELKKAKRDASLVVENDKLIVSKKMKEKNEEQILTRLENIALYNQIIEQLNKPIYEKMQLKTVLREKLIVNYEKFKNLTIKEQAEVLHNIIKRLSTGATLADLSLLEEGKNVGLIRINKNITNKEIKLILRSPTGANDKVIRL